MPDDTSWMDPPTVPKDRPCPRCDGRKEIDHPKYLDALALVEKTLAPVAEQLKGLQFTGEAPHYTQIQETAREELLKTYPPGACPQCRGAGTVRMEQPGDQPSLRGGKPR